MAKKAKTSIGDEAPAGTSSALKTIMISPHLSPQRSRLSPQRGPITHYPLASVEVCIFTANLARFAGEGRQQEEPLRATPDMPPPSTTLSRERSPARASTGEITRVEEETTSAGTGSSIPAMSIVGEGTTPP